MFVSKGIIDMSETNEYELVHATESDCDLLFNWANDRAVRSNSFKSEFINYQSHIDWFKKKMDSKDSTIYILKVNKVKAGVVRLDKIKEYTYLINYSIAKENRRKGYGTILLRLIKQRYKSRLLIGKVKKDNIGSAKAFLKADYKMKEEADSYVFYSFDKE